MLQDHNSANCQKIWAKIYCPQWWIFQFRGPRQDFSKIDVAEKKKRSDLGLHIFFRNSWCLLKKKKGLHFHFLSVFPIFIPKSGCSLKKKKDLHSESFSEQTSAADSKL